MQGLKEGVIGFRGYRGSIGGIYSGGLGFRVWGFRVYWFRFGEFLRRCGAGS